MIDFIIPDTYETFIDRERLEHVADVSLKQATALKNCSFTLKITTNQGIRSFNRTYREMDEATDVLSFPLGFQDPETGSFYLGDIIISLQKARSQARQANTSLQFEIEMLLVHGILHLCGFDHLEPADFEKMSALQDQILVNLNNPLTGSIHGE